MSATPCDLALVEKIAAIVPDTGPLGHIARFQGQLGPW
jgi:hypothetical protein